MGSCGSKTDVKPKPAGKNSQEKENLQQNQKTKPNQDYEQNAGQKIPESKPMQVLPISKREYQKSQLIDKGAFGSVYCALDKKKGKLMAVKTVQLVGDKKAIVKTIQALKQEVKLLKRLEHKNIIKYYFTEVSPNLDSVDIALEYISTGSLRSVLSKVKLEEPTIRLYTRQILEGVAYLHKNGVIHRDLKGANILIDSDGTVKLTDFGTSKLIDQDEGQFQLNNSLKGTPYWMAPEVVRREGHSYPADIWSLAGVVFEMLCGSPPYSTQFANIIDVMREIEAGRKPIYPKKISKQARDFMDRCYVSAELRPSAEELLADPFVTVEDPQTTESDQQSMNQQGRILQGQASTKHRDSRRSIERAFRGYTAQDQKERSSERGAPTFSEHRAAQQPARQRIDEVPIVTSYTRSQQQYEQQIMEARLERQASRDGFSKRRWEQELREELARNQQVTKG